MSTDSGVGSLSSETGEEKEVELQLDHPYDILTSVRIDLEPYVLLVQVSGRKMSNYHESHHFAVLNFTESTLRFTFSV